MMKKQAVFAGVVLAVGVLAAISCRRSDVRSTVIEVPQMDDALSVRIVTNAALDEVVGQYDGTRNEAEVDLSKKTVLYHEGERLRSPDYRRRIEAKIAEIGYNARVTGVRHNPPPLVPTEDGPIQMWPARFTATISVPDMDTSTDANIIVDAIAYARLGNDHPRVAVDPSSRRVVATYESLLLSRKSIEQAIANVGFDANNTPAMLGKPDAIPHGWTPVSL